MSVITDPWAGYAVTQGYGPTPPSNPYGEPVQFGSVPFHDGVDFAAPTGTPVPAPFAGTIVEAGDRGDGYGSKVSLRRADGFLAFYGHLGSITVAPGQAVSTGALLGTTDNTGHSTGPHLHLGAHTPGGGTLSPYSFPDAAASGTGVAPTAAGGIKLAAIVGAALIGSMAWDFVFSD